ncbi:uncharacterized protein LOC129732210 [Wyeomyia smithii]|uniref:uncharacterized protein LOC129732210 n=1 Tax=Wyeomyia smithii TaxID=174621 RepID=UPI00246818FC|nr:uncharacterized protein LOC129732210 [Wyeomyia smithii]
MRLLRAALVALFLAGTELLAAPLAADRDRDRIDPLNSQDFFSSTVNRTKRKSKALALATNMIMNRLEQGGDPYQFRTAQQEESFDRLSRSPAANSRQRTRQVDDEEDVDETTPFGEGGKVTLQIPGKVFGSATNLFLTVAKLFGDYITNSAIRTARFMQLFQPLFGRNLYIYIPPSTTESNEI